MDIKETLKLACEDVLKNSYSPYSNMKVAASLLTKSGKIFTGVNIENSSYALTSCEKKCCFKCCGKWRKGIYGYGHSDR